MSPITRILSRPVNKPFRTRDINDESPYLDDEGFLAFAPDDIEDPHNWTTPRRTCISMAAILLVMNASMFRFAWSAEYK
jgi:DHA1 family multidrug resistance protein-like MFS transporter